jgi:hypothetical protein
MVDSGLTVPILYANQVQECQTFTLSYNTYREEGLKAKCLILIPSDVEDYQTLKESCNKQTVALSYNSHKADLVNLTKKISSLLRGQRLESIGFAAHGSEEGKLQLTKKHIVTLKSLACDKQQAIFWKTIGSFIRKDGRIDLLGCDIGKFNSKEILRSYAVELRYLS